MSERYKKGIKSIGVGFIDFIISLPLFVVVSYLIFLFIAVFRIPDKIAYVLFIMVIGIVLIKLIVDTIRKKTKGLYAFWISLIVCYIILLMFIFPLYIKENLPETVVFLLPGIFLPYLFLIIKSIKSNREKFGWGCGRFWGFWVGIPIGIILIVIYIVPGIVILKNRSLNAKLNKNIGISSVKELYKPTSKENGNHLLDTQNFPQNSKFTTFFREYAEDSYKPIPSSAFKKEIVRSASLYIPYLDSFSKYSFIQKARLGDYEINPFSAPIPNFERAIKIAKAGLTSTVFDIHNKNYISASDKINEVWHIAKIVRNNNLISGMVSKVIGEYTIDFIFRGIREKWILKKRFSALPRQILSDIEKLPIVIPGAYEFIENKPARLPCLGAEMFQFKEILKKNPAKAIFFYNFHKKRFLYKILGRMSYPLMIFNYPAMLKLIQIYIPERFSSKDEYIRYFLNSDVKSKALHFKRIISRRLIPNIIIFLFMPDYSRIINKEISYIALSRIMQTAISVERQRLKTGKYPEHPDNILEDPFSGKPLIYKRINKGYIIYSVGENRVDDGGDVISQKSKDIGFRKGDTISFSK